MKHANGSEYFARAPDSRARNLRGCSNAWHLVKKHVLTLRDTIETKLMAPKISCQKLTLSIILSFSLRNAWKFLPEYRPMGWHVAMCILYTLSCPEDLRKISNVWQESAPMPKCGCAAHFHLSSSRSTPVIVFLMANPSYRLKDCVARVCSDWRQARLCCWWKMMKWVNRVNSTECSSLCEAQLWSQASNDLSPN